MLTRNTVDHVEALLAQGQLSQREIARQLKISRGTVNAIANGRRRERPQAMPSDDFGLFEGPPARCPGCGGMVYMPCMLCEVRRLKQLDESQAASPRPPKRVAPTLVANPIEYTELASLFSSGDCVA